MPRPTVKCGTTSGASSRPFDDVLAAEFIAVDDVGEGRADEQREEG